MKIGHQLAYLCTKLNFLANGCILGQNTRKETPFKIQFYCQDIINLLFAHFLNHINGISLFFLPHFHALCLLAGKFAARFSNCCNSLNFEAEVNFNTTMQNDLKWRETCTGLKFDLELFNDSQTKFICDSLYKHPVQ